jgi:hypothetical protein
MQAVRGLTLTVEQRTINALHSATRALAERRNSLLKAPSRVCAESPCARGGPARSRQQPWSSCITNTTAPHDHRSKSTFTGKGSL